MRENYRNSIASIKKFPQFTTMHVIDGQAGLIICASLIFYSLTIDNILNITEHRKNLENGNLYDIVGNMSEWTLMKKYGGDIGRFITLGYGYKSTSSLSYWGSFAKGYKNTPSLGFRVCIY